MSGVCWFVVDLIGRFYPILGRLAIDAGCDLFTGFIDNALGVAVHDSQLLTSASVDQPIIRKCQ